MHIMVSLLSRSHMYFHALNNLVFCVSGVYALSMMMAIATSGACRQDSLKVNY